MIPTSLLSPLCLFSPPKSIRGPLFVNAIVVIPTYNEREDILALTPAIQHAAPGLHILIVDDNSPDGIGFAVLRTCRQP